MKRLAQILIAVSMALPLLAQHEVPASLHSEVVEVTGTIVHIHLNPGDRTPYLEVKTADETTDVHLGPMRYLIEQNFTPKTGQEVKVKGFLVDDYIAATEVTLPAKKKTFRIRDDEGWPLWQGARGGGARRRQGRR